MIIYKTTNLLNYKFYVGQDSNNNPNYYGSGIILNYAINKYGKENFRKDILEYCNSFDELNIREKFWIKLTRCQNRSIGYNIAPGGNGAFFTEDRNKRISKSLIGHEVTEETREKLRQANIGKTLSEETKRKIRQSSKGNLPWNTGKQLSNEHKQKISNAISGENNPFYGKQHTEETCEKIRQANLGKTYSHEVNKKKGLPGKNNPFYGKHHSEKTRKKISEKVSMSLLGKNNPRARSVTINGIKYDTINEAKSKLNISYKKVIKLSKGETS